MSDLECRGLTKQFGGVHALQDVSISARRGEIVGVIGPNGSGKSTMLNVLTGFLKPDSGSVWWDGRDITSVRAHRRSRLGLVRTFQEETVFDDLPVLEALSYGVASHRNSAEASRRVADEVGLPRTVLHRRSGLLSWGQGRLLGIGMALATKPDMLLLDEPFAGLNRQFAEETTNLLRSLRDAGTGLLIVEHEMSLLLPLCDRLVAMAEGRVIGDGPVDEVIASPVVQRAYFGSVVDHAEDR